MILALPYTAPGISHPVASAQGTRHWFRAPVCNALSITSLLMIRVSRDPYPCPLPSFCSASPQLPVAYRQWRGATRAPSFPDSHTVSLDPHFHPGSCINHSLSFQLYLRKPPYRPSRHSSSLQQTHRVSLRQRRGGVYGSQPPRTRNTRLLILA